MSDTEKEQFHTMAKEIAIMKRWLPIFLFVGTLIGFSVKGTLWFEGNVASKTDVQRLEVKVTELNSTMQAYIQSNEDVHTKLRGGITVNKHSIDSLGSIVSVRYKGFVTEYRDKNGNTHVND